MPAGTDEALMLAFQQLPWVERLVAASVCRVRAVFAAIYCADAPLDSL